VSSEKELYSDLVLIYHKACKECNYNASRLLQLLTYKPAVQAVKDLIPQQTYGFGKLHILGRLDLSIEAVVIQDKYCSLFTKEELDICRDRLSAAGYPIE
jgi:hypothetical protein